MLYLLLIPVVLLAFLGLGLSGPESIISQVNIACYHLVLDMQSPALMKVLLIGSYGAQKKVLLVAVMAITLILAGQKNWQACLLTVAYIALAGGLIICSKHGFVSPRPPIFEEMLSPFSYPSGHVAFFTAITAWVLALGGLSRRYWPLYLKWQSVAILLVAFTRVGLGHHWLFDAVGGYLLGMLPLLLLRMVIINHTVRWQWHHYAVVVFSYLLAWGGYAHKHLAMDLQWCKVETPVVQNIDMVAWWQHQQVLPAMRDNRFGQPVAPFNVQWHGDIERIEDTLTTAGWSSLALNDPLWLRLLHAVDKQYLWPSFPGRWHHQMPRLMMVSPQGQVLILWDSHYRIAGTPLWIGAIDEDMAELAGGIEPDWQLDHTELLPWQQQAMVWMIRSQS